MTGPPRSLSRPGEIVRQHDPDRFLTSLFAPESHRSTLWVLYAFNHELARAREAAREQVAVLIRLQWWREIVEGARRRHEVAEPLGHALDANALDPALLETMIAGREAEAAPVETLGAWRDYLLAAYGGVAAAAAAALGADEGGQDAARHWGAVYGGAAVLRSAETDAARGRSRLPEDVLARHGGHAGRAALDELSAVVRSLDQPGRVSRSIVAATLPVVLARRDLRRLHAPPAPRGLGDRLAVALAAARGHV